MIVFAGSILKKYLTNVNLSNKAAPGRYVPLLKAYLTRVFQPEGGNKQRIDIRRFTLVKLRLFKRVVPHVLQNIHHRPWKRREDNVNLRDRFRETMTFNKGVRAPKWEFGYWGATVKRWYTEGMPRVRPALPDPSITTPTSSLYSAAWTSQGTDYLPNGVAVRTVTDIYEVITNGAANGAMPAWGNRFSHNELVLLASYVASLRGTSPAGTIRGPEGDAIPAWPDVRADAPPAGAGGQ